MSIARIGLDLIPEVMVIGEDFDNHNGDIVLALAGITDLDCRKPRNFELDIGILLSKMMRTKDVAKRLPRITKAVTALYDELGPSWCADALEAYYAGLCPVADPATEVERRVGQAANSLNSIKPRYWKALWYAMRIVWAELRTPRSPAFAA